MALFLGTRVRSGLLLGLLASGCHQAHDAQPKAADVEVAQEPGEPTGEPEPVDEPAVDASVPESASEHEAEPAPTEPKPKPDVLVDKPHEPAPVEAQPKPQPLAAPPLAVNEPGQPVIVPTEPTTPTKAPPVRIALPAPTLGACAFIPESETTAATDNPECPEGTYYGNVQLARAEDVAKVAGCTRITGSVEVYTSYITSIEALKSLRVVERDLTFSRWRFDPDPVRGNANLSSFHGLESLACVGGHFQLRDATDPADLALLKSVVEVGGNLDLPRFSGGPLTLTALQRVWGDLTAPEGFTAPPLESVYGSINAPGLSTDAVYVGCQSGALCRDGVLGCNYTVTDQAALEKLSSCEITVNDLTLEMSQIEDLSPLKRLRHVSRTLRFNGSDGAPQTQLDGLTSLQTVGMLAVGTFPQLDSLDGLLDNIRFERFLNRTRIHGEIWPAPSGLGGGVTLEHLPQLRNLQAFSKYEFLSLYIDDCDALVDLSGLQALREGTLIIRDSANIQSLNGAPQLRQLHGLYLLHLPRLSDLSALSAVDVTERYFVDLPLLEVP